MAVKKHPQSSTPAPVIFVCLLQFYELARKEIGALIVADEHPNIVRCFAMEEDTEFVYLALERCKQSLNDVLGTGTPQEGWSFVGPDGMPTPLCMRVSNLPFNRS